MDNNTSRLREETPVVFRCDADPICRTLDQAAVDVTGAAAKASARGLSRVCVHDPEDTLHEMLIVLESGRYIRPHKNAISTKSFHMLEGVMDVLCFSEEGEFRCATRIGDLTSSHPFAIRLGKGVFNCVIVRSERAVYLETLNGAAPVWASWAPAPDDPEAESYALELDRLARQVLE